MANFRRNSIHLPYLTDRSVTTMADFSIGQTEEGAGDMGSKNLRRPKLDLSFASYGYTSPQQYRIISPTCSEGSDPLISHLMMSGSRSNTPDDSDISNSPEAVADLIVSEYKFFKCLLLSLIN